MKDKKVIIKTSVEIGNARYPTETKFYVAPAFNNKVVFKHSGKVGPRCSKKKDLMLAMMFKES